MRCASLFACVLFATTPAFAHNVGVWLPRDGTPVGVSKDGRFVTMQEVDDKEKISAFDLNMRSSDPLFREQASIPVDADWLKAHPTEPLVLGQTSPDKKTKVVIETVKDTGSAKGKKRAWKWQKTHFELDMQKEVSVKSPEMIVYLERAGQRWELGRLPEVEDQQRDGIARGLNVELRVAWSKDGRRVAAVCNFFRARKEDYYTDYVFVMASSGTHVPTLLVHSATATPVELEAVRGKVEAAGFDIMHTNVLQPDSRTPIAAPAVFVARPSAAKAGQRLAAVIGAQVRQPVVAEMNDWVQELASAEQDSLPIALMRDELVLVWTGAPSTKP